MIINSIFYRMQLQSVKFIFYTKLKAETQSYQPVIGGSPILIAYGKMIFVVCWTKTNGFRKSFNSFLIGTLLEIFIAPILHFLRTLYT